MNLEEKDARIVSGYCFVGEDDAELARQEEKKVAYLEKYMDYSMPEKVLKVYRKAVDERIFKTPLGYDYLRKMQEFLINSPEIDNSEVPPIRFYVNFHPVAKKERKLISESGEPQKSQENKKPFLVSVIINVALTVAVAAMFVIALKSESPNIINYENALINKYSAWEQEISAREQAVRERELELKVREN